MSSRETVVTLGIDLILLATTCASTTCLLTSITNDATKIRMLDFGLLSLSSTNLFHLYSKTSFIILYIFPSKQVYQKSVRILNVIASSTFFLTGSANLATPIRFLSLSQIATLLI